MTKTLLSLVAASLLLASSQAFTPRTQPTHHQHMTRLASATRSSRSSSLSMGLMDFFSEDARKEREARKQREIEEQEKLQRQILERRKNPEKMEEYEARVTVRRAGIMAGKNMDNFKVMVDDEDE